MPKNRKWDTRREEKTIEKKLLMSCKHLNALSTRNRTAIMEILFHFLIRNKNRRKQNKRHAFQWFIFFFFIQRLKGNQKNKILKSNLQKDYLFLFDFVFCGVEISSSTLSRNKNGQGKCLLTWKWFHLQFQFSFFLWKMLILFKSFFVVFLLVLVLMEIVFRVF